MMVTLLGDWERLLIMQKILYIFACDSHVPTVYLMIELCNAFTDSTLYVVVEGLYNFFFIFWRVSYSSHFGSYKYIN
jgi:hypothetical protein